MKRLIGFKYAIRGIFTAFKSEFNVKVDFISAILVIIFGFVFKVSTFEWIALIFCIGLVISAELFNTAIEYTVNYISTERNEIAKKIKDISAAAVFVLSLVSVVIACLIFIPKIISFF